MKAVQIEKLLAGVMSNFLASIDKEDIQTIIKEKSFITGGCIPSMLMDEYVNDYDIYFYNKEDAEKVKQYFESRKSCSTTSGNTETKFSVKLITENAINLSDKIQLVVKFTGTPEQVTSKFDWQHIKSYFYFDKLKGYQLVFVDDVYRLIVEKELIYTGSDYPLSSLLRLKKYLKKGWNVSNSTIVHIVLDVAAVLHSAERNRKTIKEQKHISSHNSIIVDDPVIEENIVVVPDIQMQGEISVLENTQAPITFNVEDIIYHLNGVDPLTIQYKLEERTGQYLTIPEIIELIKR